MVKPEATERAGRVKAVVFDVDGVLTDGSILLDARGEEIKRFNVQDGTGIKYLQRAGLRVAIISGRQSAATQARARELGIVDVYQGAKEKSAAFADLLATHGLKLEEVACVGDDLPDLPIMRLSGLAVAVANARPEVKALAHYITELPGGMGAAREFAEWLLKTTGRWDAIMARYAR